MKRKENGRSMVEVIISLVLIGLLSVGSIIGFQSISAKIKAHDVAQMIATLVKERQHQAMTATTNSENPQDIVVVGMDVHVENGVDGNMGKYFWVSTTAETNAFCEELVESDLIQPQLVTYNGQVEGACPAKLTFYFEKKAGDLPSLTYENSNGEKVLCPHGATCSENEDDFSCVSGYYKVNGETCVPCGDGAAICEGETLLCVAGYGKKNGSCTPCDGRKVSENGESCELCPAGQKSNEDHTECVNCTVRDTDCGCPDETPNADGAGGCVECRTVSHCAKLYPNIDSTAFQCIDNTCQTKKGCDSENPIYTGEHCCPVDKPYWDEGVGNCVSAKADARITFEGADSVDYLCDTDYAVQITNVEANCSLCENREVLAGYCVPKCGSNQFLLRTSTETVRPKVYCASCDILSSGFNALADSSDVCEKYCPNREHYNVGFNPQYQCQLKECPDGYFSCSGGCCSCNSLNAENITKWYTAGGALRANAVSSCEACNGKYGPRKATTSGGRYCYLENCPTGYFKSGLNCRSCTDNSNYTSTQEDCDQCVDKNGNLLRHFERGYCIKGTTCANGSAYNAGAGCGECAPNEFYVAGKCISCDDPKYYSDATDATECARCPQRTMHTIRTDGSGNGRTCMLIAEVGKSWYSNAGTQPCDSIKGGTAYTKENECLDYCPNRVISNSYTCSLPCSEGFFWGTMGNNSWGCISCDVDESYKRISMIKRENNTNVTYTSECAEACPGKRFDRVVNGVQYCVKCRASETKFKTPEECESCLGTWDENEEKCTLPSDNS